MNADEHASLGQAVANLAAWIETMRCEGGYGGPVVHWWQQSFIYTGAALDWRYEGIIEGYLNLWRQTDQTHWLERAMRAGDDLVEGQLVDNGNFPASSFELNPATAGTPHEAACDVGLLLLAKALKEQGRPEWERYFFTAERNLRLFYLGRLWSEEKQIIRDGVKGMSFVPNKAATACEALFLLAELRGERDGRSLVERYVFPTLRHLIAHQVSKSTGGVNGVNGVNGANVDALDGAIAQNSFAGRRVEKYFPIYIARCIPALLRAHQWGGDQHSPFLDAALRAMAFLMRWLAPDGSLPTAIYPDLRYNAFPSWISPLGDVLRAMEACRSYGWHDDEDRNSQGAKATDIILRRILQGQDAIGGIRTARGFAGQVWGRPSALPDVRDVLHVLGWCDKSFRALTIYVGKEVPEATISPFEAECTFRGKPMFFIEMENVIEITNAQRGNVVYRWWKGDPFPEQASPDFWLR